VQGLAAALDDADSRSKVEAVQHIAGRSRGIVTHRPSYRRVSNRLRIWGSGVRISSGAPLRYTLSPPNATVFSRLTGRGG